MRLALSSAAAPAASPAELADGCVHRGLPGLFLALRGGGRSGDEETALEACGEAAAGAELAIAGIEARSWSWAAGHDAPRHSARLGAPVVIRAAEVEVDGLPALADRYAAAGGRLLVAVGTVPAVAREWAELVRGLASPALALAWEVAPGVDDLHQAGDMIAALGGELALVRLHGGGPETMGQGGQGVGALMGRLALSRYGGMIVIGPSRPEYHGAWRAWLGRRGGTGCGSAGEPGVLRMGASS